MADRTAESNSTRDRILAAAQGVFAEHGLKGATVGAIASAAQVNRALLYYYFESKEDIYRCLINEGAEAFRSVLGEVPGGEVPIRDRLHCLVRSYLRFCLTDRPLARIIRHDLLGGDVGRALLEAPFTEIAETLSQILVEGVRQGELRPMDERLAAYSLLGMMNVLHDVVLLKGVPPDLESATDHTLELFLRGAASG